MRWPVVRLIAAREARDQLRDRRTMFLILGLPVVMYLLFGGVGFLFVTYLKGKSLTVGVVGAGHLPPPGGEGGYPPLFTADGQFVPKYVGEAADAADAAGGPLVVVPLDAADEGKLAAREVDVIVAFDPGLADRLGRDERPAARAAALAAGSAAGGPWAGVGPAGWAVNPATWWRPAVRVLGREGEENSKRAVRRATEAVRLWAADVKAARLTRAGLPPDFDAPVDIQDPESRKSAGKKVADELRDTLAKGVPLLVVLWMLTGVIYPAVDMTAGEKERGTMETLLISPAGRAEIVGGKVLAVTALGFGTALWNVLLLGGVLTAARLLLAAAVPFPEVSALGLAAGAAVALPLALLFAAACLSLGVFARSTKEGNYYMVPAFLVVTPLAYLALAPGMELDGRMSWVPVTNALLLQQRLMSVRPDPFPWQHLPAVVLSLSACIAVGLWFAVRQFKREAVLFREAEAAGGGRGFRLFGRKAADQSP